MEMARRRLRHRDDRLGTELDFYMPFNSAPPVLALSLSLYSIAPWLAVRGGVECRSCARVLHVVPAGL